MPLTSLYAFIWLQWAVTLGLGTYFFAIPIGVREWQQLPMIQAVLRKYSARRLAFGRIYVRTFLVVMSLGTAVCLIAAGYNIYETFATPDPHLALLSEFETVSVQAIEPLLLQAFIILMLFVQRARGRRGLRNMARSLQAQAEADRVQVAAETSL